MQNLIKIICLAVLNMSLAYAQKYNKMNTSFLDTPNEGYSCSNNTTGFIGQKKCEDAKFEVKNEL